MKYNTKKGFTLIELLVVISIIGLLASVILSSLNTARSKARDAERIQTLQQIQKALTLYYDDNGSYPVGTSLWGGVFADRTATVATWKHLSNALSTYIKTLPIDPSKNIGLPPSSWNSNFGYVYWTDSTGSKYQLMARLENSGPLSCSKKQYIEIVSNAFFGPNLGTSLCGGSFATANKNLYVISSE